MADAITALTKSVSGVVEGVAGEAAGLAANESVVGLAVGGYGYHKYRQYKA